MTVVESSCALDVVVVDAEAPSSPLCAFGTDGDRRAGAWLVVRVAGSPVGVVEVDFAGRDVVPAAEVDALVAAARRAAAAPPAAPVAPADLPTITVVIPTNVGRPEQLRAGVAALAALDYPGLEVVVVDNRRGSVVPGPDDVLAVVAATHPGVRVVRQPVPGISAARNAGVAAARGEVVAFTDDDVQADPGWLTAIGTRFARHPDIEAVTGVILPAELRTVAQLWFERYYGGFGGQRVFEPLVYRGAAGGRSITGRASVAVQDATGREVRRFSVYGAGVCGAGANMAFRVSALTRLGGFDQALGTGTPGRGGEDLAMVIKLLWTGGSLAYEPAAAVYHTHREDYPALERQIRDYGLGFTAMLTALLLEDPRHALGLAVAVTRAVTRGVRQVAERAAPGRSRLPQVPDLVDGSTAVGPPVPAPLKRHEQIGNLVGPSAYVRSRRAARRSPSPVGA